MVSILCIICILILILKVCWKSGLVAFVVLQARNKPADGGVIGGQKLQAGQKTPTHGPKGAQSKTTGKPTQKSTAQKGQPIKQAPAKVAAAAANKNNKKNKKGNNNRNQPDLIVTIDLVS